LACDGAGLVFVRIFCGHAEVSTLSCIFTSVSATPPMTHTPPSKNAIALAYQTGDTAPKVVAKGRGLVAEQIIARAKEHGVFVHESKELVALLSQVELDDHIPPALYRAIAELLAWIHRIEAAQQPEDNV
jgi:flagellar biosynthesis protein